jgi:hypothetical protein
MADGRWQKVPSAIFHLPSGCPGGLLHRRFCTQFRNYLAVCVKGVVVRTKRTIELLAGGVLDRLLLVLIDGL